MRKNLVRTLFIGAVGMAAGGLVVMAPQVHAIAAALVQVTNTATNPVLTKRVDDPALHAWGTRVYPGYPNYVASFTVPADKYTVIDRLSGFAYSNSVIDVSVYVVTNGVIVGYEVQFSQSRGGPSYLPPNNIRLVADPGSTVTVTVDSTISPDLGGMNVDIG